MQRRSSGSDDGGDCQNPLPVSAVAAITHHSLRVDAVPTAQATSAQTPGRPPNHHRQPSRTSDSRRASVDLWPSARSRRSGNFSWKPSTPQSIPIDKPPLSLPLDPSVVPAMAAKSDEDSDDVDKVPDSKGVLRRPRSRSPWAIGLLTLITVALGLGFIATILHSSITRCLDAKGCIMSYMRPSYVKLSDFDTEHTRFGSKYSLYLYRELEVDEDAKVGGPTVPVTLAHSCPASVLTGDCIFFFVAARHARAVYTRKRWEL